MFDSRALLAILTVLGVIVAPGVPAASPASPDRTETHLARLDDLPTGCNMEETAGIVADFLAAYNQGDEQRLDRLFPDETAPEGVSVPGQFDWYTVNTAEAGEFFTRDSLDLQAYFATRHEQGESLTLRRLQIVPPPDNPRLAINHVGFNYHLERHAADLPTTNTLIGKGSIDCGTGQIKRWAMGDIPSSLADPTPIATPIRDYGGLVWSLHERTSMLLSTSAVIDIIRPLFPDADYVFLIRAEVGSLGEPLILLAAGYDLSGGDAAADARSIEWQGTIVDEVAGGAVEVYAGDQLVVLSLGADSAGQALLADVVGPPLDLA